MKSIMSVNLPISVIQDMKHLLNKSSFVEKAVIARLNGMKNYQLDDERAEELVQNLLTRHAMKDLELDSVTLTVLEKLYLELIE
jgi:hypothetical protein